VQSVQLIEACATSLLGKPEYSGLVGVVLRATRWGLLSGGRQCCSCLTTGGGAEDELFIVTCIDSGLSWVAPVESLEYVFCMVQVFCGVPDFIVFWCVALPLSSILELVVVESRVDNFVDFIFIFSFYLNRGRELLDL